VRALDKGHASPALRWKTYYTLVGQYANLQDRWKAGVIARFGLQFET
jgi:hypothetical protein